MCVFSMTNHTLFKEKKHVLYMFYIDQGPIQPEGLSSPEILTQAVMKMHITYNLNKVL